MNLRLKDLILATLFTLIILTVMEILTTSFVPSLGITKYRFSIHIIIILYLSLKLENPYLGAIIFFTQYTHSLFSVEGWAIGTFVGIIISIIISHLKDFIHLSNFVVIIFVTQIFMLIWFGLSSSLLLIHIDDGELIMDRFWHFLVESFILSLLAPFIFRFMDKIWRPYGGQKILEERA